MPSIIYASFPPAEALLAAVAVGRRHGIPVIADMRDIWSHYPDRPYRSRLDFLIERNLERRVLGSCSHVIANTGRSKELIVKELGLAADQITVIPNGYDERDFVAQPVKTNHPEQRFIVLHAGAITNMTDTSRAPCLSLRQRLGLGYQPIDIDEATRSPRWVLEAAQQLLERHPEYAQFLMIEFIGTASARLAEEVGRFPYPECVSLRPRLSKREVMDSYRRASMLLLLQHSYVYQRREYGFAVPGKLYEYLRIGKPILAALQRGDARDIVERLGAGITVSPKDPGAIATALEEGISRWRCGLPVGPSARSDSIKEYDRQHLTGQLAEILKAAHHSRGRVLRRGAPQ